MKCNNCPAEMLTGRAFETSELCNGPVDGELIRDGDLVLSFRAVCHAIIAQKIMVGTYQPHELHLRAALNTQDTVIDLTETEIEYPQSA